eukprot:Pgem_evm1s44
MREERRKRREDKLKRDFGIVFSDSEYTEDSDDDESGSGESGDEKTSPASTTPVPPPAPVAAPP